MGSGGSIIFGVEDRTGVILGVSPDEEALKQRFTSMLRSLVRPTPASELTYQSPDGKNLLVADIQSSQGPLHALMIDPDKPEYYVRRGAATFYARSEELTAIIETRQSGKP